MPPKKRRISLDSHRRHLSKDRSAKRLRKSNETLEESLRRRTQIDIRMSEIRSNEDEEERAHRLSQNVARMADMRANETEEERSSRNQINANRQRTQR